MKEYESIKLSEVKGLDEALYTIGRSYREAKGNVDACSLKKSETIGGILKHKLERVINEIRVPGEEGERLGVGIEALDDSGKYWRLYPTNYDDITINVKKRSILETDSSKRGVLIDIPMAKDSISILFGYSKREERIENDSGKEIKITSNYAIMPRADNYAKGVHSLQRKCKKEKNKVHPKTAKGIYRPLSFKEIMEIRVNHCEISREDEMIGVSEYWLSSCTGIAYKENSSKFKIIPECEELINIDKDFYGTSFPIDYDKISGVELDFSKGIYNQKLAKEDALEHKGWLAVVEGDKALLKAYADIVFKESHIDEAMSFYKIIKSGNGLMSLDIHHMSFHSLAGGIYKLNDKSHFIRKIK